MGILFLFFRVCLVFLSVFYFLVVSANGFYFPLRHDHAGKRGGKGIVTKNREQKELKDAQDVRFPALDLVSCF